MMNENNGIENIARNIAKKKILLFLFGGGCGTTFLAFLLIFPLFVVILLTIGIIGGNDSSNSNVVSNNGECGFTLSKTSLSKSEFKSKIEEYAKTYSQWQIFATYANDYYDYALSKGINPELVLTVAAKENGGKDLSSNNYWGLKCPNGSTSCGTYPSFMDGAKALIDSAANYSSLSDWMGKYSYIGYFWYNPGGPGDGGCYYAPYIFGDNIPDRVKSACKGSYCAYTDSDQSLRNQWVSTGKNPRSGCTPTTDEDQQTYAKWLVEDKMAPSRKAIFGLEANEGVACTGGSSVDASGFVGKYVQWMVNTAADDSVGYSQSTRFLNPNVDCASFVWYGLVKGAGVNANDLGGSAFWTGNMEQLLTRIGFKKYIYKSEKDLQVGDILWVHNSSHQHTEVYVGNSKNVGAHDNIDGKDGDSSGKEVDVSNTGNDSFGWMAYFRYEDSEK